jgi:hypothetical protein
VGSVGRKYEELVFYDSPSRAILQGIPTLASCAPYQYIFGTANGAFYIVKLCIRKDSDRVELQGRSLQSLLNVEGVDS